MPLRRLKIALDAGHLALPDVCVLNAPNDMDLDARASQGFFSAYSALKARGVDVTPEPKGPFVSVVVQCHRARAMTYHFLKTAIEGVAVGGVVALNGDKTDGVEAIVKELRKRFDDVEVFSKAHGKLAWFTRPDVLPDLSDWDAKPFEIDCGFTSFPGIFSSDRPDKGSELLLTHLPALKGRVADLGAGWGYLARHILSFDAVSGLDMVEADFHACRMARINVTDTRATHHWADVLTFEGKSFDTVVMNPPFHTSRKPDPALGQAFIRKAAEILSPRGSLWMVANRNLPYEAVLEESFQVIKTVAQTGGFKVVHAERPQNSRKTR